VRTVIERLVRRGRLHRRAEGRACLYRPAESRAEAPKPSRRSPRRLVDGFAALAVTGLVESLRGDDEQMARLRAAGAGRARAGDGAVSEHLGG